MANFFYSAILDSGDHLWCAHREAADSAPRVRGESEHNRTFANWDHGNQHAATAALTALEEEVRAKLHWRELVIGEGMDGKSLQRHTPF